MNNPEEITVNESKQMKVVLRRHTWYSIMRKLNEGDEQSKQMALLIWMDIRGQE